MGCLSLIPWYFVFLIMYRKCRPRGIMKAAWFYFPSRYSIYHPLTPLFSSIFVMSIDQSLYLLSISITVSLLVSSGSNGHKALYSLVLLDIYLIHKWYISVLPKIYQIPFIDAPPSFPVPCNHSLVVFKLGRTNITRLWLRGLNNYLNTYIFCQLVR